MSPTTLSLLLLLLLIVQSQARVNSHGFWHRFLSQPHFALFRSKTNSYRWTFFLLAVYQVYVGHVSRKVDMHSYIPGIPRWWYRPVDRVTFLLFLIKFHERSSIAHYCEESPVILYAVYGIFDRIRKKRHCWICRHFIWTYVYTYKANIIEEKGVHATSASGDVKIDDGDSGYG